MTAASQNATEGSGRTMGSSAPRREHGEEPPFDAPRAPWDFIRLLTGRASRAKGNCCHSERRQSDAYRCFT